MKAFIGGVVAAIILAVAGYFYFGTVLQQSATQAYTTKSARI